MIKTRYEIENEVGNLSEKIANEHNLSSDFYGDHYCDEIEDLMRNVERAATEEERKECYDEIENIFESYADAEFERIKEMQTDVWFNIVNQVRYNYILHYGYDSYEHKSIKWEAEYNKEEYDFFESKVEDQLDPACFSWRKIEVDDDQYSVEFEFSECESLYISADIDDVDKKKIVEYFKNNWRHGLNDNEIPKFLLSLNENYRYSHHDDINTSYNYDVYKIDEDGNVQDGGDIYTYKHYYNFMNC